jgi:outer membrane beta-barrel protein
MALISNGEKIMKKTMLVLMLFSTRAFAQAEAQSPEQSIRVLQQKPLVKKNRAEIVPLFSVGLNDTFSQHIGVGGNITYHITEEWSVGAEYLKFFGFKSSFADEVTAFGVADKTRLLDYTFGFNGNFSPFQGKFLFFGKGPIYWDISFTVGLGATRTETRSLRFTGSLGCGMRFLVWRFLTFEVGYRDYIFRDDLGGGDKRFVNNMQLVFGLGVFAPWTYHYKYPK